jgi:hypothetical protein
MLYVVSVPESRRSATNSAVSGCRAAYATSSKFVVASYSESGDVTFSAASSTNTRSPPQRDDRFLHPTRSSSEPRSQKLDLGGEHSRVRGAGSMRAVHRETAYAALSPNAARQAAELEPRSDKRCRVEGSQRAPRTPVS